MGHLRDWSPTESNLALNEERPAPSPPPLPNPSPSSIPVETWRIAEQATKGIISQVQPTVVSEERRRAVIDYVQRLIRGFVGCEVSPFGSVPLKTYLPDGDIDLTAFGGPNVEDALANDVSSVLEAEDQNSDAEFVVKDVQVINAEVKLVKCLVQNIVVDISFNQLGGLCTLCFLELVDRLIGNDNLFKRSIILIKAWCYYESRILGAHHGLISTYALETLVLYIFHLFHSSLNGPLAVLYTFLDYFSKFDWDNYCISVNGRVHISSLPEIIAERPDNGGLDLLLSNEFLRECVETFSVPSRGPEINSRTFIQKHLNIVDPLKENNNLGRSISKGNSYRIRSAFTYGARKLGRILLQPEGTITDELRKFFMNTLDRHGSGQRPDVHDFYPLSDYKGGYGNGMSTEHYFQEDKTVFLSTSADHGAENRFGSEESLQNGIVDMSMSGTKMKVSRTLNEFQKGSLESILATGMSEAENFPNVAAVAGSRLSGDANDLATSRSRNLTISHDITTNSPSASDDSNSLSGKTHHAPHLYFPHPVMENSKNGNGNPDQNHTDSYDDANWERMMPAAVPTDSYPILSPIACNWERMTPAGVIGSPEALNTAADLNGEYDTHFHSLQCGRRWCHESSLNPSISPMPLPMPSPFQVKNSWNSIRRPPQFRRGAYSHVNANGIVPRPAFFPLNLPIGSPFGMEELPKPRGTGTYFPNTNHQLNRVPRFSPRGRSLGQVRSPRNSRAVNSLETSIYDKSNRELSQAPTSSQQGIGDFESSDPNQSDSPGRKEFSNPIGLLLPPEKVVEFGSFAQLQLGAPLVGRSGNPGTSVIIPNSSMSPQVSEYQTKPLFDTNEDRLQSYRLKDEDDFPPLSA